MNAVEPKAFQLEKDGTEFRRNCGASSEHLLVGVIARLSPEKGVEVFLHAMKRIVKDVPCVKAVLVGEGQEADRLKAMVKIGGLTSHVHLAGYQTDISSIYSASDLVVIPSHSEALPNVLLKPFFITGPLWPPPSAVFRKSCKGIYPRGSYRRPIPPSWPIR